MGDFLFGKSFALQNFTEKLIENVSIELKCIAWKLSEVVKVFAVAIAVDTVPSALTHNH